MIPYALAVLSGVLLVLIHPRFSLWWAAPFAATPLLVALAREWRPKHRFLLGYTAGIVFWGGMCYWIHFVMDVHGGLGPWIGAVVFALFCALKGLHLGLFALLAGVLIQHRWAALTIPALWVIVERIPDPFGFMWLPLGNAAVNLSLPMRLAPFTGVYGLSFVLSVMSAAIALMLLRRDRRELLPLALVFVPLLLPSLPASDSAPERAVAVQPNIPESQRWTEQMVADMHAAYQNLSLAPAQEAKPALILWPEVPAPLYYENDASLRDRVARIAAASGAHVLIGTVAYNQNKAPLNAAVMVSPDGQALGRYDKMLLVPFGEYVPFPFATLAGKITSEIGDFVPGERIVTFHTADQTVGAFICYESAFPHLVRQFARDGATVLANLSNDGYFGTTAAREQHLALVRMRAAENRRWILRATNDGITAAIDPAGRPVATLPEFTPASRLLPFAGESSVTLYSRWGDWFAWLCGAVALAALLWSQRPHYNPATTRKAAPRRR